MTREEGEMRPDGHGPDAATQLAVALGDEVRSYGIEPGRVGGGLDDIMEETREQMKALGFAAAALATVGLLAFLLSRRRRR